jgi:hypothetical protein
MVLTDSNHASAPASGEPLQAGKRRQLNAAGLLVEGRPVNHVELYTASHLLQRRTSKKVKNVGISEKHAALLMTLCLVRHLRAVRGEPAYRPALRGMGVNQVVTR